MRIGNWALTGLALALIASVPTAVRAEFDPKQAKEDWKKLGTLCEKYQRELLSQSEVKAKGAAWYDEWQAWKKEFEPARATFKERYGESVPGILEAFKGLERPMGVEMDAWQVASLSYDLDLAQQEEKFAGWAVGWGKDAYRVSNTIKSDNKEKLELKYVRAEGAVRYFKLAKQWNPKGDYDEYIQQAEAAVKEARPLWEETLKALKWPGHNADFAGPGQADALAQAALDFLRKNPNWTKPEYDDEHVPLAACVTGKGWDVSKKAPLTEAPTQYSVEIFVAFGGQKEPTLAYCYHMVFYTREEAGVAKEPPFYYANAKQYAHFRMLRENVPGGK